MEKVIAVIVTYNRKNLLAECIAALRKQTHRIDKILVINNGSMDNTREWLREQPDIDFVTQKNMGSAGGFYTGIKKAYKDEYTWIWLMDDDGYPKEDALEKLLDTDLEDLCLRTCAVINKEDKKSFVWKTKNLETLDEVKNKLLKNNVHPFNGTLLNRKIVERVGFPDAGLFLWGDETEYYFRIIKKHAIPAFTILDSIHYHPGKSYSYKTDWEFSTAWKMYYYVRNRFYIMKTRYSICKPLAISMYIIFLLSYSASVVIFQKTNKMKKLEFILWPVKDAFTNNLSVTPSQILEKIGTKQSSFRFINNYIKRLKSMV